METDTHDIGYRKDILKYIIYRPEDTDVELRTVVIPIELISDAGDHIFYLFILKMLQKAFDQYMNVLFSNVE